MEHRKVNLRGKRAIVCHPEDEEASELGRQLLRIGLEVEHIWESPNTDAKKSDFVFTLLSREILYEDIAEASFIKANTVCVLIIESESPMILQEVSKWDAIITKPFRPFGLLAQLVHASERKQLEGKLRKRVSVLSRKMEGFQEVERAKEYLMENYRISGPQAYGTLRENAMKQRKTIEDVAKDINAAKTVIGSIAGGESMTNVSVFDAKRRSRTQE